MLEMANKKKIKIIDESNRIIKIPKEPDEIILSGTSTPPPKKGVKKGDKEDGTGNESNVKSENE